MEPQNPEQPEPTAYQPVSPPAAPPPEPAALNPLPAARPEEQVICKIKRHPIGIIGTYVAVGFLLLVLAVLAFVVAPSVFSGYDRGQLMTIGAIIFLIAAVAGTG